MNPLTLRLSVGQLNLIVDKKITIWMNVMHPDVFECVSVWVYKFYVFVRLVSIWLNQLIPAERREEVGELSLSWN